MLKTTSLGSKHNLKVKKEKFGKWQKVRYVDVDVDGRRLVQAFNV